MRIVIIPYHYHIDVLFQLLDNIDAVTIVGVITMPAFAKCLRKELVNAGKDIEVAYELSAITTEYDEVYYFEDIYTKYKNKWETQISIVEKNGIKVNRIMDRVGNELFKESQLLETPVIAISRTNNLIDSSRLILGILKKFKEIGVKATVVSESIISKIYNQHSFPDSFFEKLNMETKCKDLGRILVDICQEEGTEILIIDVPGIYTNEAMFIVQKVVTVDYNIILIDAHKYDKLYDTYLVEEIKSLAGFKVNSIVFSEFATTFLNNEVGEECILTEIGLKKLVSKNSSTVFDINDIFNQIYNCFQTVEVIR